MAIHIPPFHPVLGVYVAPAPNPATFVGVKQDYRLNLLSSASDPILAAADTRIALEKRKRKEAARGRG